MSKIQDIPLYERPREKAYLYGIDSLSNPELLALLLGTGGAKNQSALELAYQLLIRFQSMEGIAKAGFRELCAIKGISKAKAVRLQAAFLLQKSALGERILSGEENDLIQNTALFFQSKFSEESQEICYVCIVDSHGAIVGIKEIFRGTTTQISVSSRMILQAVLDSGNRFILVHNHPSDNVSPSSDDLMLTSDLDLRCLSLGIRFIEHIIIGKSAYYRMNEARTCPYR